MLLFDPCGVSRWGDVERVNWSQDWLGYDHSLTIYADYISYILTKLTECIRVNKVLWINE